MWKKITLCKPVKIKGILTTATSIGIKRIWRSHIHFIYSFAGCWSK